MTNEKIHKEIEFLSAASRQELLVRWRQVFGAPAPSHLSLPLLRRGVMHQVQIETFGDLMPGHKRALARAAENVPSVSRRIPKSGAQLVREWNGIAHVVDVIEGGFRYKEKTYASLTAIAKEITGAHWSGPRFFGIKGTTR